MASRQREIAVSEFFLKNRHLLGFDSPHKALLTAVKEAVDNALDATEEAGFLPDILVSVTTVRPDVLLVAVEDNGPGIVEEQIAKIFGKLLYGSRFHKLSQSRGQQGIGISAAGMYAQLTTGRPMCILSRTSPKQKAWRFVLGIDTSRNRPDLHRKEQVDWDRPHGTRVEMEIEAQYQRGTHSVEMYLKQTAIANPHVTFTLVDPTGTKTVFPRTARKRPASPVEIKPHPHGIELGRLIAMLHGTEAKHLKKFLTSEFSRVGPKTAKEIIDTAGGRLTARSYPRRIAHAQAKRLHRAIQKTHVCAPSTSCIVPIGEELLVEGLRKEICADVYFTTTRPAAVYRGNPFQIEVGIAYGKPGGVGLRVVDGGRIERVACEVTSEDLVAKEGEPARILRFANRVPLLYQQSACAITKVVSQMSWRAYGIEQPRASLPIAPMVIVVHMASVWVPFTSESKDAIASYPEITKEIRLALQECARKLRAHLHGGRALKREYERREAIGRYLPHVGEALQALLELDDDARDRTVGMLDDTLHRSRSVR